MLGDSMGMTAKEAALEFGRIIESRERPDGR
jgi:hypothetical protein